MRTALFTVLLAITFSAQGQYVTPAKDTSPITMAAGAQFKASHWKEFWWGKHYRPEWTTPVTFPTLHLWQVDGGLTPQKQGGGHQTKTLRLLSKNGREFVLRTIDKNLDVLIPESLRGSFINDIVNDQISTAHPYGPLAIAKMSGSLGFYHTNPAIYYVADDPALGEFRETFANRLCLLEERTNGDGWEHNPRFGNADKIIGTEKLLEHFGKTTKYHVDQAALLRVRLFDMIVNDWDRHEDQWVWAVRDSAELRLVEPIARDRDQAFSKTDGVNMFLLSQPWAFRPLENLAPHVRDLRGANYSARNLDRQFLNQLTRTDWENAISFVQSHLTDAAIDSGINEMPAAVNKWQGNHLRKRLRQRRDHIRKDAMHYYRIQSRQVVINGSEDDETFLVHVTDPRHVTVTGISEKNDTFYHRAFNRADTREINIYGLEGKDHFIVDGSGRNSFHIRLLGGDGKDHYKTSDDMHGKAATVYDSIIPDKLNTAHLKVQRKWDTLYNYQRASLKWDYFIPLIMPGFNPDDGVSIGLGLLYRRQQWGKTPFGWQQRFAVNYATETGAIGFDYKGLFKQALGKWDIDLTASYLGPRYTLNYYGLGNETELNGHDRSFFRVKANVLDLSPGISRSWKKNYFRLGLHYQTVEILQSQSKFVTSPESDVDPSVFSDKKFAGISSQFEFDTRDNSRLTRKGVLFSSKASWIDNFEKDNRNFLKLEGSFAFYQHISKFIVFAHRTGAATNIGDYEFYQANYLGGSSNLRGFWRGRFAGRSSFYQNTEIRLGLGNMKNYVFRGVFGVLGFFDDGRVWIPGEKSTKMHTAFGGGIFYLPYNLVALNLYYSKSDEADIISLRVGFLF